MRAWEVIAWLFTAPSAVAVIAVAGVALGWE